MHSNHYWDLNHQQIFFRQFVCGKSKIIHIFWLKLVYHLFFFFLVKNIQAFLWEIYTEKLALAPQRHKWQVIRIYIYLLRYQVWTHHPRVLYQSKERQTCPEGIDFIIKETSTVNNKIHSGFSAWRYLKLGKRILTKMYWAQTWYKGKGSAFINNLAVIVLFSDSISFFFQKVDSYEKHHVSKYFCELHGILIKLFSVTSW